MTATRARAVFQTWAEHALRSQRSTTTSINVFETQLCRSDRCLGMKSESQRAYKTKATTKRPVHCEQFCIHRPHFLMLIAPNRCCRQVARYTCPTCNVPYCSLICFRSEKHGQCSEGFYKRELESEIRSKPSASANERQRMLEMLRRLEEEGTQDDDLDSDEADVEYDESNALATKLSEINIGSSMQSHVTSFV